MRTVAQRSIRGNMRAKYCGERIEASAKTGHFAQGVRILPAPAIRGAASPREAGAPQAAVLEHSRLPYAKIVVPAHLALRRAARRVGLLSHGQRAARAAEFGLYPHCGALYVQRRVPLLLEVGCSPRADVERTPRHAV